MSLPSWMLRETERNPRHSHIAVFVGPDADHRALAGQLTVDHDQAEDLFRLMTDDTNRVQIERAEAGPASHVVLPVVAAESFGDGPVLGRCIHGVDLDHEFCEKGCHA